MANGGKPCLDCELVVYFLLGGFELTSRSNGHKKFAYLFLVSSVLGKRQNARKKSVLPTQPILTRHTGHRPLAATGKIES